MTLEQFNALSEEEKNAFLTSEEKLQSDLKNVEAERDSFKTENDKLLEESKKTQEDLKSAKELNFTLARKIDHAEPAKSSEDLIHDMFMKNRKEQK